MQNKNTILWHFGGHFCGKGVWGWRGGEIWLGEDYGGEAERFEELLELSLA